MKDKEKQIEEMAKVKENLIELFKNSSAFEFGEEVRKCSYTPKKGEEAYSFYVGTGKGTLTIDLDKLADEVLEKYQPKLPEDSVVLPKKDAKIYQEIYDFMKEFGLVSVEETKTFIKFWQKTYKNRWTRERETAKNILTKLQPYIGGWVLFKELEKEYGIEVEIKE